MNGPCDMARDDAGVTFWIQVVAVLHCEWTKKSTPVFLKIRFSVFGFLKIGRGAICGCAVTAFCRRQSEHRSIIVRKVERKLITIKDRRAMKRQRSRPVFPLWLWISLSLRKVMFFTAENHWCLLAFVELICIRKASICSFNSVMKGKKFLILEWAGTLLFLRRQFSSSSNESSWECPSK